MNCVFWICKLGFYETCLKYIFCIQLNIVTTYSSLDLSFSVVVWSYRFCIFKPKPVRKTSRNKCSACWPCLLLPATSRRNDFFKSPFLSLCPSPKSRWHSQGWQEIWKLQQSHKGRLSCFDPITLQFARRCPNAFNVLVYIFNFLNHSLNSYYFMTLWEFCVKGCSCGNQRMALDWWIENSIEVKVAQNDE